MIKVRYFASLREQLGKDQDIIDNAAAIVSVGDLKNALPTPLPPHTLCAVNYDYANDEAPLRDGDEVAFFPTVTGG